MKKYVSPEIEKINFSEMDVYTANSSLTGSGDMTGDIPENWEYGD